MDASTTKVLTTNDTREVLEVLGPVAIRWKWIGIVLNLSISNMEIIEEENTSTDEKLHNMILLWLKQCYDTEKYGLPTWLALIEAVRSKIGGNNSALAEEAHRNKLVSLPRKGK